MLRKSLYLISQRSFSSQPQTPSPYSFLQPSIFSLKPTTNRQPSPRKLTSETPITELQKSNLESKLHQSLSEKNTDEAWKAFKTLTTLSSLPQKPLTNSLIAHLSSVGDAHSLKRAYASVVYVLEKKPSLLDRETVISLLESMKKVDAKAPALALVRSMLKNRFFIPFEMWGGVLVGICKKDGSFKGFSGVFNDCCRVVVDEKVRFLSPDLGACNAVMNYYCCEVQSISDAEKLVETMSVLGVRPDEVSFGLLGHLYAVKGFNEKVVELEDLMCRFGFSDKRGFFHNLISGYMKSGDFDSVSSTALRGLSAGEGRGFFQETYDVLVKGFIENWDYKSLANLISESKKIEPSSIVVDRSFGYGVISSCVGVGLLDKAHKILDEMNAQGANVGLGVYVPILKAYCKEQRTAEASQLVSEICSFGLRLDVDTYDALIESSMTCQDFQSAFSLFRDMRESRIHELKRSYLTIMTGLTEHHRPELMAAFLDEVVEDPRIELGAHDWNSIIHAFCKAGRLEDARRTFRRMVFLQFEPNGQTYLSLINGFVNIEKYFSVLLLWNEVKRKISGEGDKKFKLDHSLIDAFLYALVKGGFFDAAMQVVEKSQEMKIYVDKWRYKQAFMETHKKLKVSKLRKRNFRKMEALIAFKNWAGLSS